MISKVSALSFPLPPPRVCGCVCECAKATAQCKTNKNIVIFKPYWFSIATQNKCAYYVYLSVASRWYHRRMLWNQSVYYIPWCVHLPILSDIVDVRQTKKYIFIFSPGVSVSLRHYAIISRSRTYFHCQIRRIYEVIKRYLGNFQNENSPPSLMEFFKKNYTQWWIHLVAMLFHIIISWILFCFVLSKRKGDNLTSAHFSPNCIASSLCIYPIDWKIAFNQRKPLSFPS